MALTCKQCGKRSYSEWCWRHKPRKPIESKKPIPKQSDKEKEYQKYKEEVLRPALIERDGNNCWCCGRPAYVDEKLDIEHKLTKGSRPDLKRELRNLRLYCRYPCHDNKTNNVLCVH